MIAAVPVRHAIAAFVLIAVVSCGGEQTREAVVAAPVDFAPAPSASSAPVASSVPSAQSAPSALPASSTRSEPFAEAEPAGASNALDAGNEADPVSVRAAEAYAAELQRFLRARWTIPAAIAPGAAEHLSVAFRVNIAPNMRIWHVFPEPTRKSGNDAFDASARDLFTRLIDEHTELPAPPPAVAGRFRGRTVIILLDGGARGSSAAGRRP